MTIYEAALNAVTARLTLRDPDERADIIATAEDAAEGGGLPTKVREIASLIGLGWRLSGRNATNDDPRQIFAQGAAMAGALILLATAAWSWTNAETGDAPAKVAIAGLIAAALTPWRAPRVLLSIIATGSWLLLIGPAQTVIASAVLAVALSVVGWRADHQPQGLVLSLVVAIAIGFETMLLSINGTGWLSLSVVMVLSAVGPFALLLIGWHDPRFALAATAIWFWRLAAFDLAELTIAARELGNDLTIDTLIIRWIAMATGVIAGFIVSHRALDRAITI